MDKKFNVDSDPCDVRRAFDEDGYVVIEAALPAALIDRFLGAYEKCRSDPFFIYNSQSQHTAMRAEVNEYGHTIESMQNASQLGLFPKFTRAFEDCIYHRQVSHALSMVDGESQHVSWQNMFFDRSTGTIEHQDSWYLDTDPGGRLVGTWYALEDIREGCGAFFVSPGSHRLGVLERSAYASHDAFVAAVQKFVADHDCQFEAKLLNKGDILLWHPYLIHGAFEPTDLSMSRRSFTSHFYPLGALARDIESEKLLSIYDHANPRATQNPDILTAYRFHSAVYNALVYAKFGWHRLTRKSDYIQMGRRFYS